MNQEANQTETIEDVEPEMLTLTCDVCGMTETGEDEELHEKWTPEAYVINENANIIRTLTCICGTCSNAIDFNPSYERYGKTIKGYVMSENIYKRLKDSYVEDEHLTYSQRQVKKVIESQGEMYEHPPTIILKSADGVATNELNIPEYMLQAIYHMFGDDYEHQEP